MEFLKRHYEKLILLGLSLAFIATMFHVLSIIDRTREVKDSDLQIPKFTADYQPKDPKNPDFDGDSLATRAAPRWAASKSRSVDCSDYSSDLVRTFEMARCPKCDMVIPFRPHFQNGKCPWCEQELKPPPDRPRARVGIRTAEDSDGDGIKDADEQKYGLNPQDPDDALQDNDGDGFSNLFEVEQGFSPINAFSHPPLWMRLRFKGLDRVPLPIKFKGVINITDENQNDKKKWEFQFNYPRPPKPDRTGIESLGDTIRIEKREYKLVDAELKQRRVKKANPKPGEDPYETIDESKLYLEEVVEADSSGKTPVPDKLVFTAGAVAYSSDRRLILEDVGVPEKEGERPTLVLRPGDTFTFGNRRTGTVKLVLKEIDEEAKTALLNDASGKNANPELDARKKKMLVTAEGAIPSDMWVTHEVVQRNETPDNGPGM